MLASRKTYAQALRSGLFDTADPGLVPGLPDDQSEALARALQKVQADGRPLFLPPGRYNVGELEMPAYVHLVGVPGESRLSFSGGRFMLAGRHARAFRLDGITIDGAVVPLAPEGRALLALEDVAQISIDDCRITGSSASGLWMRNSAGRVVQSDFTAIRHVGIDVDESKGGMEIAGNRVSDCGDTGILIERDDEGADNSIVTGNRVTGIRADSGGSGQNGNGINLDKANGVIVSDNRVDDCAFSAIRCYSSDGISVTGNVATNSGETALYVEFAFEGAVVANNLIDGATDGISFANFLEHGGRLGTCTGNVVRHIRGSRRDGNEDPQPGAGIAAEADVAITGNVVEDAVWGLQLGWGPHLRDVTATGNVIRNTRIGVAVSVVEGGGPALVSGNLISGASEGAVLGVLWREVATEDLVDGEALVPGVTISGNVAE